MDHYHQQVTANLSHSINYKHQNYHQGFSNHLPHHRVSSNKARHVSPAVNTGGSASASAVTTLRGIAPIKGSWKI